MRPEASHLGSRQRHSSNVVSDVSVASVAQPRANGNEHRRVAQSRTLEMQTWRNALEFVSSRGSPHKATRGPICLNSCHDRMRQVPENLRSGRSEQDPSRSICDRDHLSSPNGRLNREAARDSLCLDCVKECLKVQKQTSGKRKGLCISCASCTFVVQIQVKIHGPDMPADRLGP